MLFNSLSFLIFFPIVLLVYFIVPNRIKNFWLLISSYYFYMCWNAKYALLILTSTIITFISGLLLEKIKNSKNESKKTFLKKLVVIASFTTNLGILFYFKYINFLFDLLKDSFKLLNITINTPTFDIILPVGISFYTFQALSYTIDVYRNEIKAEKNFLRYALFVSFFPQLVAGPIERSKNLLKQFVKPKNFNYEMAREGFLLMIWGYFLKLVISDRISIFVDKVYGDFHTFPGWYIVIATIFFSIQIYCDFYGYSVIAMGAAKILGIDLMQNFKAPYLSTSISNFWKRWHISLTSWFKDYLYIPLGGSRKSPIRTHFNKMIVFLISGLWHGADLSYVIWGGLNGLYLVFANILKPTRDFIVSILNLNRNSIGHKALKGIITYILINISWVFFRAKNFTEAIEIFKSMISTNNIWIFFDGSLFQCGLIREHFYVLIPSLLILLLSDIATLNNITVRNVIIKQDFWCRSFIMIFAICFILIFGIWGSGYNPQGFIYFQF